MAIVVATAAGCGRPAGSIFDTTVDLQWPAGAERARIRYVGVIESDVDLAPARSFLQDLGAAVFGAASAHTMLTPFDVCTDDGSRVFVCDSNGQLVHVFDLDRRTYDQWRPAGDGVFAQPVSIAWDPAGRLLVADSVAGTLFAFHAGRPHGEALGSAALARPCGVAVDRRTSRIYVADAGHHAVVVLDAAGNEIDRIGGRGTTLGKFNYPTNVAIDRDGRVYVTDTLNFRVQVFEPDGRPLRQIGSHGDLPGYFSRPKDLALDADGHLYVIDAHFESVQIFDSGGTLLLSFGEEGTGPGQFWLPSGIHIDSNQRIWIADSYNRRVQVFEYLPEASP
ncbi:MAG: 6-bladed beta-propeller [Phycisphaerales bacterium]|nr:6-bladed beta-propeller [Phycisphaerales bacterium]